MASIFSPATSSAALLLLFISTILPTHMSSASHLQLRSLLAANDEEDLPSPVSKTKSLPKKKPIPETPEIMSKLLAKSFKIGTKNSTSSSISSSATIYSANAKSKLNKTIFSTIPNNANLTAPEIKFKLNKTSSAMWTNTTKPLKPIKPLKSNSTKSILLKSDLTKTQQLRSPTSTLKLQKKLDAKDPPPAKHRSTPKSMSQASTANWLEDADITGVGEDDDDLISEFRELPSRLHSAFVPDLEKLSTTSKLYLSKTHHKIAAGVKPFFGTKYAPSIASAASSALVVLPLLLVLALFHHLLRTGSSASLHRALLIVQAYLAIYFATLSVTALVTGLEPLRFFYAASPSAYAWTQATQTFGYLVYLVAQLTALVVAFSAGEGDRKTGKAVGIAQMLLGLAVGMHYYITVFHRAVTGEAPRANWKIHGIYAACFIVICGVGRVDCRKKAYLQDDGGDVSKTN